MTSTLLVQQAEAAPRQARGLGNRALALPCIGCSHQCLWQALRIGEQSRIGCGWHPEFVSLKGVAVRLWNEAKAARYDQKKLRA